MRDWPQRGNSTNSRRSWCKEQLRCRLDWPEQISAWQRSHAGGICLKSAFWNAPEICPLWCRGTQFTGRSLTRDSLLQNCLQEFRASCRAPRAAVPPGPSCGTRARPQTLPLRCLPSTLHWDASHPASSPFRRLRSVFMEPAKRVDSGLRRPYGNSQHSDLEIWMLTPSSVKHSLRARLRTVNGRAQC